MRDMVTGVSTGLAVGSTDYAPCPMETICPCSEPLPDIHFHDEAGFSLRCVRCSREYIVTFADVDGRRQLVWEKVSAW